MNRASAIPNAKIEINGITWYVPQNTPNEEQQAKLSKDIFEWDRQIILTQSILFLEAVKTRNLWTWDLGTGSGVVVPVYISVRFQRRDRLNDQTLNNDTFLDLQSQVPIA